MSVTVELAHPTAVLIALSRREDALLGCEPGHATDESLRQVRRSQAVIWQEIGWHGERELRNATYRNSGIDPREDVQ